MIPSKFEYAIKVTQIGRQILSPDLVNNYQKITMTLFVTLNFVYWTLMIQQPVSNIKYPVSCRLLHNIKFQLFFFWFRYAWVRNQAAILVPV